MTIKFSLLKIYIQVVSNPLNNFQLILKVDLLWPKCSNYALKLKKSAAQSIQLQKIAITPQALTIPC
jgi:hypothetical protein